MTRGLEAAPPRLAMRLLAAILSDRERESFEGDLLEAYHAVRAGGRSPLRARLWFWRQTLAATLALRAPRAATAETLPSGDSGMMTFFSDLRHGARLLRRSPAFTAICVLTLGLGIGATTAIFSVVNPVLLQPLPYAQPDQLVMLWERDAGGERSNVGFATFADIAREATTLSGTAAMGLWQPTLSAAEEAERLQGQNVSANFFRVLGVRPLLRRDFLQEEDVQEKNRVVVISHALWQRRFGGDSSLVGQPVSLGGTPYTVVGILPRSFESVLAPDAQIWKPIAYDASLAWACRTCRHLRMVARVRDGVAPVTAAAELQRISAGLVAAHPKDYPAAGMHVVQLQDNVTQSSRPILLGIASAVILILLIAVANVASLQLGRAARREEEFAIRAALGAGRGRVAQQLLAEGVLLAVLGGAAGVLVAYIALPMFVSRLPDSLPRVGTVRVDGLALAMAATLTLVLGIATGLAPVWQAGRRSLAGGLRSGTRLTGPRRHMARGSLVVTEVALALMLLVGAGLLGRSLITLLSVDPGFDSSGLLTLEVQASGPRYEEHSAVYANHDQLRQALSAIPGVTDVGVASQFPLSGNVDGYGVRAQDKPLVNPELAPSADRYVVSPGFMKALRIPLMRGRGFTEADSRDSVPAVVIVSAALAAKIWPGEEPLGKRVQVGGTDSPWREVVGIAGNIRHSGLDAELTQQVYVPERQWLWADNSVTIVVRTNGDPSAMASSVRAAVHAVDPGQAMGQVATVGSLIATSNAQRRLALTLFAAFAGVALLLAGAGIYGVLTTSVTERTREIGVRTALGATPLAIARIVVAHGARLALPGLAIGMLGALALGRFLRSLLFGVGPTDPLTLGAVAALLALVAAGACLVPAVRAVRVDPMRALREE